MTDAQTGAEAAPAAPDIDAYGVDRAQIREHAPEISLGDALRVKVIDMPTLIQLKEEGGRPKDLAALPVLRATLDESGRP